MVVGGGDVDRPPADPRMRCDVGLQSMLRQMVQRLLVVRQANLDGKVMERRLLLAAATPHLAVPVRWPVSVEQPDDLRMTGNPVSDPHEGDRVVQDTDERKPQDIAIENDRALEVGDTQDDLAEPKRPDGICRSMLRRCLRFMHHATPSDLGRPSDTQELACPPPRPPPGSPGSTAPCSWPRAAAVTPSPWTARPTSAAATSRRGPWKWC